MAGGANQGLEVFFGPDGQQQDFAVGADVNVEHTGIMLNFVEVFSVSVSEGRNTLRQQFPKLLDSFGRMIPDVLNLDLAIQFQQHKPSLPARVLSYWYTIPARQKFRFFHAFLGSYGVL